ncbi:MAG TPA: GNAT family N-acetyltransferase [bacterium]|nr:GNAT family N-acetyltransferase [bacterium]
MSVRNLDYLFRPRRIALIGVTINPNSVGGRVLANLVTGGFGGVVYPINAESEAVMGIPCYPNLAALPKTPDLAVICAAAVKVPDAVRECGEAGVKAIIIMTAGFREIGEAGRRLEDDIRQVQARFDGLRILGPNCLGIIVPGLNLNVSFALGMPKPGHVAFLSQSGALCTAILDWAIMAKVGFSYFVSVGNGLDVGFGDLIDYFGEDDNTKSIITYIESVNNPRAFMTAARAFARTKPIIVYKAGRFAESAAVASSHTGAMASSDAVYEAAFRRVGMARVFDIGDIFDCAELIGRNKIPTGSRLAIVTNAGGPGVMATDALIAAGGSLARLSASTIAGLNQVLPPSWSHANPVDVLGDATPKRIEKAMQIVLDDPQVDALLVIVTPQAMTNPTGMARAVGTLAASTSKPILAAWLGGQSMREGRQLLIDAGVSAYRTPEQAIRAFMTLVAYARNLETLYETPKDMPVDFAWDRRQIRADFMAQIGESVILPEHIAKSLVAAYGIPTTRTLVAADAEAACAAADQLGYPVVLKILSPEITHKSDVGGVALNLPDAAAVRAAFAAITAGAAATMPQARIDGVTVQPMATVRDTVELIAGIRKDPAFGTVILVGMGGVTAELFGDRAIGFPPLNERLARWMLESLKIWPLLKGYRGRPPVDVGKLIESLIRLSYLAADYPEIAELDINPLLAGPQGVVALDARIILDREAVGRDAEPYAHLALRPYPEMYVKRVTLKDGTEVLLRPIKPEDEPLWMAMLESCSKETIYSRFRYFFHWASHAVAVRYCYIDYDREIAIVAEHNAGGKRQLLGIGRLIADPDRETVEYAVLITDAWQKKELGSILTDHCLEIAQRWKMKRVVAQTTTDNRPMIAVFEKRGFAVTYADDDTTVDVERHLA